MPTGQCSGSAPSLPWHLQHIKICLLAITFQPLVHCTHSQALCTRQNNIISMKVNTNLLKRIVLFLHSTLRLCMISDSVVINVILSNYTE